MSQPISTVHGNLYIAPQVDGEGVPATDGFKKFNKVSGKVAIGKEAGSATWLDGSRYANSFDYTSSIQVTGSFVVQGDASSIGALAAWALGEDTTTGVGPYTHTINAASTIPYLTVITTLGNTDDATVSQIHEHYDVQISSLAIEGTADNDVLECTVEVVGIHPGKVRSTEPTPDTLAEDPLLHYNAEDSFILAGINSGDEVKEVNQCSITISNDITPYFGDSVRPAALVPGRGEISVDFTVLATNETLPMLNNYYYGTENPSAGDEPTADVFKESFEVNYSRGAGVDERGVQITIPELVFSVEEYPEASADGGPVEIAATGMARITDGDTVEDIISVVATTNDADDYVSGPVGS